MRHHFSRFAPALSRYSHRHGSPTPEQLASARHHFIGTLALDDYYSAARCESDVMELLPKVWNDDNIAIMCGGSMMYIDAVTRGIDQLPTISDDIRRHVMQLYESQGIEGVRATLRNLDPEYLLRTADPANHRRLVHAVEICLEAGVPTHHFAPAKSSNDRSTPSR